MSHEITSTDGTMFTGEPAWHGLGIVVENAPTPQEALKIAKLDWTVEQWPLVAKNPVDDALSFQMEKNVVNVRADTRKALGIVGDGWVPFQNTEMAEFAADLAKQGDTVKVESAGSIRGGEKVWFLLRGNSFTVRTKDEVKPYILVSNGFDGNTSFRATPTTVRVVCSNTLHMVIPQKEGGRSRKMAEASFVISHTKTLKDRVEECRKALGLYEATLADNREMITRLAAKDMNSESVKRFFLEAFTRDFGAIADLPVTAKEISAREKAIEAVRACQHIFEQEMDFSGPTAWGCLNSYTGYLNNVRESNRKDPVAVADAKLSSAFFGVTAKRTLATLQQALAV